MPRLRQVPFLTSGHTHGHAGLSKAVRRASLGLGGLFPRPDDPTGLKGFRQTKSGGPTDRPSRSACKGMLTVEVPAAKAAHVAAAKAAAEMTAAEAAHWPRFPPPK